MDWIAYPLLIFQMYLFAYKPKKLAEYIEVDVLGFIVGMIACICMVVFGQQIKSVPVVITNSIIFWLNFKGFLKKIA